MLDRFLDPKGGSNSPFGIVFVGDRRAEHGEDSVAQQFLDPPAETLDVFSAPAVIGGQAQTDVFWIGGGGVGGETDQICEQNGDDASFLAGSERRTRRFFLLLRGSAGRTEP